ncbi:hypothetical protein JFT60_08070 [Pseudomonas sp. MF6772]|nr:hypothetical protein [Pseudomonas sp. MF6768]MBJ2267324.1 hypothetical protein [Pseudomonas sp. MF6772]MBL7227009.1 hypothetical protein [Pseudomonas sp.]NMX32609.1 hypothetical protein [Pseudomonas sp. WS 5413]NMY18894.1 hypothetical protein [Pseudomonas sp. WS 5410]NMY32445.1 hypothetical protein [Pseudomonas sp. WS 5412]
MTGPMGRPAGDHRSAERIIEQSAVLKDYVDGNDRWQLDRDLKRHLGDWTQANPDPDARANAAYDLDKVLRFIDNLDECKLDGSEERNGKIDGFSERGVVILHNSEADRLDQFARKGYSVLPTF